LPRAGLESNAFPEIVLGDFGNSGIQNDDLAIIPVSAYGAPVEASNDNEGSLEEWEDIFSVGELLREMSMTHIPHTGFSDLRPADRWVQDVNQQGTAPPYSAELIELLQRFEYPDMMRLMVRDLLDAVHPTFPSPEDLRDILLPQAQTQVAGFRKPANRPAGYYNNIDVSWTKPEQLMPFSYIMRYATEAGDGTNGGPPSEQNGGDSEGDQGESGSGDDGEDRNVEISSSPSSSEEGQEGSVQPSDALQQPEDSEDEADDDDQESDGSSSAAPAPPPVPPPPPSSEQLAMRELRKLHKWNGAKPRYVLRGLGFWVPVILPLKTPP
jgi:hypothetical protein